MELRCALQWRVSILFVVFGAGLLAPVPVQATVTARIGEVWLADEAHAAPFHEAFAEGLRELGYVAGKNLNLFTRYANGDESRLPRLIIELLDLKIDILLVSQAAIGPAMNDPVGAGQVVSLSRPGRNLTGLSWQSVDTATKRFGLARELRPKLSTMALLFDKGDRTGQIEAQVVEEVARRVKVTVTRYEVQTLPDLQAAFAAMANSRPQLLYVVDTPNTVGMRTQIAALALNINVPMVSENRVWTDAGAVLSYGAKLTPALKRGAVYVDKILKGARPEDLPIEQPTEFELIVNLKSAKATGVQIPDSISALADHVLR